MITIEEAKKKMDGVVIPLATIFKDDLSLDVDATQANVQWIVYRCWVWWRFHSFNY